jgi:hypothetical protein
MFKKGKQSLVVIKMIVLRSLSKGLFIRMTSLKTQALKSNSRRFSCLCSSTFLLAVALPLLAQGPGRGPGRGPQGPPPTPRAAAPIDLTGYWVSLISEDWRARMTMPPKGDAESVPLNPEGKKAAMEWDPARDEAAGEQCRAYGAGGIMRLPGRLHMTWQDDQTLKLETDAGTQTRIFHFGPPAQDQGETWQGASVASWDIPGTPMSRGGFNFGPPQTPAGGALKVVTNRLKSGYLRRNGIPYSANATITEYFERFDVPNGDSLLLVVTELVDPTYLLSPFWTSTHFRKQADSKGWSPSACTATLTTR